MDTKTNITVLQILTWNGSLCLTPISKSCTWADRLLSAVRWGNMKDIKI